ncbi:hypothetical protein AJ87_23615 [Rhizobium yanglingense]|nr:hypothetical protein AJ87_23615 [Rhizobium yanglingense]
MARRVTAGHAPPLPPSEPRVAIEIFTDAPAPESFDAVVISGRNAPRLAGDAKAAREVHLVLPESGVCTATNPALAEAASGGCCGGPSPAEADACCVADAEAKAVGRSGCGCTTPAVKQNDMEPAE